VRSAARGVLTSSKGLPKEFELARADLRPRIWLRGTFEQLRLRSFLEGGTVQLKPFPSEAIGEHLIATLVCDWPEAVQSIDNDNLTEWGASFYEAMEVARGNLEEATVSYGKIGDGFYSFMSTSFMHWLNRRMNSGRRISATRVSPWCTSMFSSFVVNSYRT